MPLTADRANQHMVDRLIAEGALWSRPLIAAFRSTPRHQFLDRVYQFHRKDNGWHEINTREPTREDLRLIYADRALITHLSAPTRDGPGTPISSSNQPSLMAQMLEDLHLAPGLRVLEIGAGTGYNAALLACVVGPGQVTSIDVDRKVLFEAWDHLRAFPERGVDVKHADGRHGYPEGVPFERIMVTAATPDVEPAWLEQMSPGGILLAPLVLAPGLAFIVRGTVYNRVLTAKLTRAAYFMPLRAEGETGEPEQRPWDHAGEMQTCPAPWAHWFDRRRPRASWLVFIQSLAFLGYLRGLAVQFQSLPDGESMFAISAGDAVCWYGERRWQVTGKAGRELGWTLWREFLELGGPRPSDYVLQAWQEPPGFPEKGGGYLRRGPRCMQHWQQIDEIERPAFI